MTAVPAPECASHSALIYRGEEEFVRHAGAFLGEGLAAGEDCLLVTSPGRAAAVREALGDGAARLDCVDSARFYSRFPRAYPSFLRRLEAYPRHGAQRLRVAAEPPTELDPVRRRAFLQYEAVANHAYSGAAVEVMCAFDASAVSDAVLGDVRRTHPWVTESGGARRSECFVEPAAFVADAPERAGGRRVDALAFSSAEDLRAVRAFARAHANAADLTGPALDDLLIAVNEAATNALRHGRAPRRIEVLRDGPRLALVVSDAGTGPDPLAGFFPPGPGVEDSRGLWLARQMCDLVEVHAGPGGTRVRMEARVPAAG